MNHRLKGTEAMVKNHIVGKGAMRKLGKWGVYMEKWAGHTREFSLFIQAIVTNLQSNKSRLIKSKARVLLSISLQTAPLVTVSRILKLLSQWEKENDTKGKAGERMPVNRGGTPSKWRWSLEGYDSDLRDDGSHRQSYETMRREADDARAW